MTLVNLPSALVNCILEEWLGNYAALSSLDVAHSNRAQRNKLLPAYRNVRCYRNKAFPYSRIVSFMRWVQSRQLCEQIFFIMRKDIDEVVSHCSPLPCVTTLTLGDDKPEGFMDVSASLAGLLRLFPNLTHLRIKDSFPSEDLTVLLSLHPPIKVFTITKDFAANVNLVLPSLLQLECLTLQTTPVILAAVDALSALPSLNRLKLENFCLSNCIDALTSEASPLRHVSTLDLHDFGRGEDLLLILERLLLRYPNLQSVRLRVGFNRLFVFEQWLALLSRQPSISYISLWGSRYERLDNGVVALFLESGGGGDDKLVGILNLIPSHITHFLSVSPDYFVGAMGLQHVADRFGGHLKCIKIQLTDSVQDSDIVYFLSRCPQLEELIIVSCKNMTDLSLLQIAKCKHLKRLHLSEGSLFTNEGFLQLPFELYTELNISFCAKFDDAVLHFMGDKCRYIKKLWVEETGVTASGMAAFLSCDIRPRLTSILVGIKLVTPLINNLEAILGPSAPNWTKKINNFGHGYELMNCMVL